MSDQPTPFVVVIPARYASSRLPGKPLLDIAGKTMIQRVYEQASLSAAAEVVVATDDARIEANCESFGAKVCMTKEDHPSGTDRIQEVAEQLGLADDAIIVNVQGDEPLIPPAIINQVAENLAGSNKALMSTLCERIEDVETVFNPNAVKVVFDDAGLALYFSRAPIPWYRDGFNQDPVQMPVGIDYYRHIGIYGYRVSFLHQYVGWSPSLLEQTESLEQLRAMSNGVAIHVEVACEKPLAGVDTQADLDLVREIIAQRG